MSPKQQQQEVTLPTTATTDLETAFPCRLVTDTVQHSTAAVAVAEKKIWMRIDRGTAAAAVMYAIWALIAFLFIFVTYLFFHYTFAGSEPPLILQHRWG